MDYERFYLLVLDILDFVMLLCMQKYNLSLQVVGVTAGDGFDTRVP